MRSKDSSALSTPAPPVRGYQHTDRGMAHRNIVLDLLRAVYWFDDAVQLNMEAHGYGQVSRAISFIVMNVALGEHRATKIAKNLGVSRQAVSQLLLGLRDRGILQIRDDPSDARSRIAEFTPDFAPFGALCQEILLKLETELGRRIGTKNVEHMMRALGEDWGEPPRLAPITQKEIRHGRKIWKEQLAADAVERSPPQNSRRKIKARRDTLPHRN